MNLTKTHRAAVSHFYAQRKAKVRRRSQIAVRAIADTAQVILPVLDKAVA